MHETREGIIIKGIGSFYYVKDDDSGQILCCRMRGSVRLRDTTPSVGDRVFYMCGNEEEGNVVTVIKERENYLQRPPVANATQAMIVFSAKRPDIDTLLLDKLIIDNDIKGLKSIVIINKTDIADEKDLQDIRNTYKDSGSEMLFMSAKDPCDPAYGIILNALKGHITVVRGVSGAGKTTIIRTLIPDYMSETGEVSRKTGRGRQTTRQSELLSIDNDTYIVDTPGFSSFSLMDADYYDLWRYYKDFYEHSDCRFPDCMHLNEPDCEVKKAVDKNEISHIRYDNYKKILEEIKNKNKY